MIEALRGLGYSTATALADIIDNSISARAKSVFLQFAWAGDDSRIVILDDGDGLDAAELDAAMRLGERSPLDHRAANDLGRFGLGLKTASFSQCRSLTVASIRDGKLNCLRWDLDILAASTDSGWHLLEGPAPGSEHLLQPLLTAGAGTLVLWEKLDRIVTRGFSQQNFLDLMDEVERHLSMVFHRYLDGAQPPLRLSINGSAVPAWDPFLKDHPATWASPTEKIRCPAGSVEVQCYVLPHRDHLTSQQEQEKAGPHGWTAQQGFYVYRNRRLLLAGSWLGLGQGRSWTKEEAHRLARIRLDIPNSADADWKIDIRKSTASPPVGLRSKLTRLAEETRARARKVFAHRGQPVSVDRSRPVMQAWKAEHSSCGLRYKIDHDHPAVRAVLEEAGGLSARIRAMLRVIEETVPVQRIWLDTTEGRETPRTGFSGEPPAEVRSVLMVMYKNLVLRKGISPALAREQLLLTEPFHSYPDLVAALPNNVSPGEQDDICN
ncbi:ATPase [Rhodomicrobium udaipurense JA643]|uniref:ATP-binding protein n=1 Tax=Rhodomicrobium udaipurense TaxID=1202716 RepID=A0A8I1KI47_9HYPH|nr:ATP-binding protein [Rhodomicrobium udaipurense]KAI94732.1 ATPase [Rhodomicrobium udaipurense JA643]MBJ7542232.1 ATP-binding protein [Rhodomicrobium udaipurense]